MQSVFKSSDKQIAGGISKSTGKHFNKYAKNEKCNFVEKKTIPGKCRGKNSRSIIATKAIHFPTSPLHKTENDKLIRED